MNKLNYCLYNTNHDDINHVIAKYIKKNSDEIYKMTIDELANACYVSRAKISKFTKMLGYDNFIAFKDDCLKETKAKKVVVANQRENLEIDFQQHLCQSMEVIEKNLFLVDQEKIGQLVGAISRASIIFLYGGAYSNLLCQYIQYECDFLKKEVILLDEELKKDYVLKQDALLIVITIEGYTLSSNQRLVRKINSYSVNKWIISTDRIDFKLLDHFNDAIIVPTLGTEVKDRRLMIRYIIDVIIGRYQYLYK